MIRTTRCPILFFTFFVFSFVELNVKAQTLQWAAEMDANSEACDAREIVVDGFGNSYVTGKFAGIIDVDPGPEVLQLTSEGLSDCFLLKFDPEGSLVWSRQIGGSGEDRGVSLVTDEEGNLYLTGRYSGMFDLDPGTPVHYSIAHGEFDIFICKFDTDGNQIWVRNIGGIGEDDPTSITIDSSGNSYITGSFEDIVDFLPGTGTYNLTSSGYTDVFILKLDSSGNFEWAKHFGGESRDVAESIDLDASGNIYTAGSFMGSADFNPGNETFNLVSHHSEGFPYTIFWNPFISKLDNTGNFIWAKQIYSERDAFINSVAIDNSDNVCFTGRFLGNTDFDPGETEHFLDPESAEIFVSKLNSSGDFLWVSQTRAVMDDQTWSVEGGNSLQVDQDGNLYITGSTEGIIDFDPGVGIYQLGNDALRILCCTWILDSSGNFIWAGNVAGANTSIGHSLCLDAYGGIYITGNFMGTADFDPGPDELIFNTGVNQFDLFVSKMSSIPISISETKGVYKLPLYPNPTFSDCSIDLSKRFDSIDLNIRNVVGQKIITKNYSSTNRIVLDLSAFPNGIYFVEVHADGEKSAAQKVVKL